MTPELRIQDAGGDTIHVSLVYPDGKAVSRWVLPEQMEGQAGRDLLAALQREAESK